MATQGEQQATGQAPRLSDLTIKGKHDESQPMQAACYEGKESVKIETRYRPLVTDPVSCA